MSILIFFYYLIGKTKKVADLGMQLLQNGNNALMVGSLSIHLPAQFHVNAFTDWENRNSKNIKMRILGYQCKQFLESKLLLLILHG